MDEIAVTSGTKTERVAKLLFFLFGIHATGTRGWDDLSNSRREPWLEYAGLVMGVLAETGEAHTWG